MPQELASGAGQWIGMGGLIHFAHTVGRSATTWCPNDAHSDVRGGLVPSEVEIPSDRGDLTGDVFIDPAPDRGSDPANTFSYTLDLTRCLAARGRSFDPGSREALVFDALLPAAQGQPVNFAEAGYAFYHQP